LEAKPLKKKRKTLLSFALHIRRIGSICSLKESQLMLKICLLKLLQLKLLKVEMSLMRRLEKKMNNKWEGLEVKLTKLFLIRL